MVPRISQLSIVVWSVLFCLFLLVSDGYSEVQYSVNATSGVLFDCDTAQFLVEHNADEVIVPASFTKVMTLYVAQEALKKGTIAVDDMVLISADAWKTGGSRMFIEVNTRVPVSELFKGIAVVSGNDACVALAEHISGNQETFVMEMNQAVERLGMKQTVFKDPSGLDPTQQTTARDMALLAYHYIKKYPQVLDFHSLTEYTYNDITQPNRNRLLRLDEGVDGLKTGYLDATTGYHLLATAERDGRRLIAVVMGAQNWYHREKEALKMLNFGFRNFELVKACTEGQVIAAIPVKQGKQDAVNAVATRAVSVTVFKQNADSVKLINDIPEFLQAPVAKGETVATLRVEMDGKEVDQVALVAAQDVKKSLLAYWRIGLAILGALVIISLILLRTGKKTKSSISG